MSKATVDGKVTVEGLGINGKSTKDSIKSQLEIMIAKYNEAIDSFDPEQKKKAMKIEEIIDSVENMGDEFKALELQLKEGKISITEAINSLIEKYKDTKIAIEIKEKKLEELSGFEKTLFNLVAIKKQLEDAKMRYSEEMAKMSKDKSLEKARLDEDEKEHKRVILSKRKIEQEEYDYETNKKRRKDEDDFMTGLDQLSTNLEAEYEIKQEILNTKLDECEDKISEYETKIQECEELVAQSKKDVQGAYHDVESKIAKAKKDAEDIAKNAEKLYKATFDGQMEVKNAKITSLAVQLEDSKKQCAELQASLKIAYEQIAEISKSSTSTVIREVAPTK